MMKTMTILAVTAALATPAALTAQMTMKAGASTNVRAQTDARAGGQQQAGTSANAEVQLAVRAGLPEAPVARAAARARAEGRSEAEAARAAAAVRTRLQASHQAIVASGRTSVDAEVIAGADALSAGAGQADLSVIARRAPRDRQLTASFRALARLGEGNGGFPRAASAIAARLESGTSDRAISRLAATGSVDAMLRGSTNGLNVGTRATTGVSGAAGGVLGGRGSVTGGLSGAVGGIIP
ncbi:MAG TPA: hypothetical protein VFT45_25125 [Longimicrobium sp.]|nr:hypothetical protein [Longimicrobium sp.]